MIAEVLALAFLASATPDEEAAAGNWNLTLKVGHRGEGLRTVVLEVEEKEEGAYAARLTSLQNRMVDADEVSFDGETLTVVYGSYRYQLEIDGDTATGKVTSPAGDQEVTAKRQSTQLFAGDAPAPYQKTWRGRVEAEGGDFVLVTRRHRFSFTNGDAFRSELEGLAGQEAEITGLWRVDRIEIQSVARSGPPSP
jgi:hypothetical protein